MAVIDYSVIRDIAESGSEYTANNNFKNKNGIKSDLFTADIKSSAKTDSVTVIDKDWVGLRFMVSDKDLDKVDVLKRYYSSANDKFTDSSLGGNIPINPLPQFTPYCDIPIRGRRSNTNKVSISDMSSQQGMGRYYSETLDDNAQTVYFEFGIPKFNSLFDFFTKAVDYNDSTLANTGRASYAYDVGKAVGNVAAFVAFPLAAFTIWTVKTVIGVLAGNGAFNYYYLKPTMQSYWGSVNTIATNIAVELGILATELLPGSEEDKKIGIPVSVNKKDMEEMRKLLPGLISGENYIDVFAIATKAQSMANKQALRDKMLYDDTRTDLDFDGYIKTKYTTKEYNAAGSTLADTINTSLLFSEYLNNTIKKPGGYEAERDQTGNPNSKSKTTKKSKEELAKELKKNPDGTYPLPESTWTEKLLTSFDSSLRDGGMHAIFRVDYTGSASESFSNDVGEIDTGNSLKSLSKKSRDLKFSLSGGNVVGETLASIGGYTKDLFMGTLDSITFGASNVLQTIIGGGYIDIPKKWNDSSISFPQISYKMKLVSPYGNPVSQMINIYLPLSMLLAGTLPQSTGKASYTSPFICSLFSKGIQDIKLGMITSLTITRGTSNLGFNKDKKALAIDIDFTVTDFSNIVTAPTNMSIFDAIFKVPMDDDNPLNKYISVIAARNLNTNKYLMPKLKLKYSRSRMAIEQMISPSAMGMRFGDSLNGILGGFVSARNLSTHA